MAGLELRMIDSWLPIRRDKTALSEETIVFHEFARKNTMDSRPEPNNGV